MTCTFRIDRLRDVEALGVLWADLESRSQASFFQSWSWIGSWIACLPETHATHVLRADLDGRVVGLAVLRRARTVRRRVIRSDAWILSETGHPELDVLTIEHNGILAERGREEEVVRGAIAWLAAHDPTWDEFRMSGLDTEIAGTILRPEPPGALRGIAEYEKSYLYVDLDKVRSAGGDLLATVSSNTRYQIRRAIREYEKIGPLSLRMAETLDEARATFASLRDLHERYWTAKGLPGAFANPFAAAFHEALIERAFPAGGIRLIAVSAGDRPIGYLYNFHRDGEISNYQSGFEYDDDAKLKPGLVSHYLAVQDEIARGTLRYDFLMGDRRYKRSLATDEGTMVWLTLQRGRLRFRLESLARTLRRRLAERSA